MASNLQSYQILHFWSKNFALIKHTYADTSLPSVTAIGLSKKCFAIDVNAQTEYDGRTPLHLVSRNGRGEVAKWLISEGADIHAKDEYRDTPLHHASNYGRGEVAKLLLSEGADIHAKNNDRKHLLMLQ